MIREKVQRGKLRILNDPFEARQARLGAGRGVVVPFNTQYAGGVRDLRQHSFRSRWPTGLNDGVHA